ncbi:hypothetical protein [uncultured Thiocystis sp.]|jgi:hypothetical protein|uniref:hypothetical protein n=1 Tax=uncultured Thiocystis sp. TaxID=1202134 RepID=UPI0025D9F8CC|nr:hypothetical protein [uncultured Thiocystis sp.]
MRRRPLDTPIVELNLLPFLDLVFAFIGILIVIFALQEAVEPDAGRALAIDDLVICVAEGDVTLYAGSTAAPVQYREAQFPALFETLAGSRAGVRNLVFALTDACFATRRRFEDEFARFTSLLKDRGEPRGVFRLAFRPLSSSPDALARLLADWREEGAAHGQ